MASGISRTSFTWRRFSLSVFDDIWIARNDLPPGEHDHEAYEMIPPLPANEARRLEILMGYEVLGTAPDPQLDDITALANEICGTPIAMISLVDKGRQWFKSKIGVEIEETPREHSFCAHAINQQTLFVVADTLEDERFVDNPFVTGDPHIRFYAGAPLVSPEGAVLGTLCVIDSRKRELTAGQSRALTVLSREVMTHLELRRKLHQLHASESRYRNLFKQNPHPMFVYDIESLRFLAVNEAAVSHYGYSPDEFLGMTIKDIRPVEDIGRLEENVASVTEGLDRAGLWRHLTRNGDLIDVEITSHTLEFDGRKAEIVLANDVTARLAAEAKARAADEVRRRAAESQSAILNALTAHIALLDARGVIVDVNESWRRFAKANQLQSEHFGVGENYLAVCVSATGDCAEEARKIAVGLREVLEGRSAGCSVEYPCHSPTELSWYRMMATPLSETERQGAVVMHVDITERKLAELRLQRLNRLHSVLSGVGEAIIRADCRQTLFDAITRIVVEDGLLCMAFICELDQRTGCVRFVSSFGEGLDYLEQLEVTTEEGPLGQGTIGTSMRTGTFDFCNDLANDPRMAPWRDQALSHGFQSCASIPLKLGSETIAALVLVADESAYFQEDEIKLLSSVADEISFAIGAIEKEERRVRAEEALRTSEANMATAQRIARIGSWELDLLCAEDVDSNSLRWSDEMYRIAGFEPGSVEISNSFFFERVPPEEHEGIRAAVAAAIEGDGVYAITHRLIRPDGAERIIHETARLFFDEQTGLPLRMVGAAHDITERRQAEIELRRSTDLLRAVTEGTSDAVFVKDLEGRYLFFNEAAASLTGKPVEEVIGFDDSKLFEGEGYKITRENDLHVILTNQVQTREEVLTSSGVTRTYLATKAPYRDGEGKVIGVIGISRDITDRKNLEQQFLRSQRIESIGTLAGGIAHDLNNVLAPIIMSIDLLRTFVDSPDATAILDMVGTSARRGAEMVGQVLTFARGVNGQFEQFDAAEVVHDVVRIIKDTFPKSIRIETVLEPELWPIKGDPTQIHQVLLNLCVNARDAMEEGGVLTIRAGKRMIDEHDAGMILDAKPGPCLTLEVEDTGHGIPLAIIDKLFDPFFTTKEVGKGTGLGLSTSLAIIKSHGGFIQAHNGPGSGARFLIQLPAVIEGICAEPGARNAVLPHGNAETVLVVDDEEAIRGIIRRTLETYGYQVLLAADGAEAVSIYVANQTAIRVVITDMMMPVMDGPSTIHVLRHLNPSLRIIGTSGINTGHNIAKATAAGVDHFLAKPYTVETLLQTIRMVLDEPGR